MSMENYKVEYADGDVSFFQFDSTDEAGGGKAQLEALRTAAKDDGSTIEKVTKADPPPAEGPTIS